MGATAGEREVPESGLVVLESERTDLCPPQ